MSLIWQCREPGDIVEISSCEGEGLIAVLSTGPIYVIPLAMLPFDRVPPLDQISPTKTWTSEE